MFDQQRRVSDSQMLDHVHQMQMTVSNRTTSPNEFEAIKRIKANLRLKETQQMEFRNRQLVYAQTHRSEQYQQAVKSLYERTDPVIQELEEERAKAHNSNGSRRTKQSDRRYRRDLQSIQSRDDLVSSHLYQNSPLWQEGQVHPVDWTNLDGDWNTYEGRLSILPELEQDFNFYFPQRRVRKGQRTRHTIRDVTEARGQLNSEIPVVDWSNHQVDLPEDMMARPSKIRGRFSI